MTDRITISPNGFIDPPSGPMQDRTLGSLRRRLERWELLHLRKHAADLAERLERAEADAQRERESAEAWWQTAMDLQQDLMDEGHTIGLTIDGKIGVINETPNTAALIALAQRVAGLNPAVGVIGAGMLAQLIDQARAALDDLPAQRIE